MDDSAENLPFDLDTLSVFSGIGVRHLKKMYHGELAPSESHVNQLSKLLNEEQLSKFDRHVHRDVEYQLSKPSRTPSGTDLYPHFPIDKVRSDDLISYRPPRRIRGAAWVRVINIVAYDDEGVMEVTLDGQVVIDIKQGTPVRMARPSS